MFLKPDTAGIIPRAVYQIGDHHIVEAVQWLAYIGLTIKNVSCRKWEVHFPGIPNVKVDGYSADNNEVFE